MHNLCNGRGTGRSSRDRERARFSSEQTNVSKVTVELKMLRTTSETSHFSTTACFLTLHCDQNP